MTKKPLLLLDSVMCLEFHCYIYHKIDLLEGLFGLDDNVKVCTHTIKSLLALPVKNVPRCVQFEKTPSQ